MGANKTKTDINKKALLESLRKCMGNVSEACGLAGISRDTYYRYYRDDEGFKEAVDDIGESNLDFAEGQLLKLMKGVELEDTEFFVYKGNVISQKVIKKYAPCKTSIIFYLKTKGKKRGYIETVENLNKDVKADPFEGMSEEEIDAYLAELEAKQKDLEEEPRDHYRDEEEE